MSKAPLQSGDMRTWCEYGRIEHAWTDDGSMARTFVPEGQFWAQRRDVSGFERANLVSTVDGIDISDDITRLRTWVGHDVTTAHVVKIKDVLYSVVSVNVLQTDRVVEYEITTGLRDTRG